jgi:hypothetical protein
MSLPATYAPAAEDMDILQKVQSAKTPADHEAIAAYYDQQAAAAKKKAAEHEKMAATYTGGGTSIGKGYPAAMPQHCQALAKSYNDEAAHYAAMAQAHRELAKSAK